MSTSHTCLMFSSVTTLMLLGLNKVNSSMTLLFYYLAPLQNDTIVMSLCMQFNFGDKGEATYLIRECPTCDLKRRDRRGEKQHQPLDEIWTRKPKKQSYTTLMLEGVNKVWPRFGQG